jgi:hypothetical protein
MLLDNKTRSNENRHFRVFDLLSNYVETGRVDIVTGYFSTSAIAKLSDEVNNAKLFRMILGDLLHAKAKDDKMSQAVAISAGGGVSEKVPQAVAQIPWSQIKNMSIEL